MVRGHGDLFREPDEELKKRMTESDWSDEVYRACFDIILLRRHERLIDKTEAIVRKTWWVAFGTWVMASAAVATAIAAFIQLHRT